MYPKMSFMEAERSLEPKVKNALESAYANILSFHKEEFPRNIVKETQTGVNMFTRIPPN